MEQKSITNAVREMSTPCALMFPIIAIGLKRKVKKTYVSPDLCNKRWTPVNDKMYLAAHLINSTDGTGKYSNVAFGESFQIYSLKQIKKGTELLLNYNREIA